MELACDLCRRVLPHRAVSAIVLRRMAAVGGWRREAGEAGEPAPDICPACWEATKMGAPVETSLDGDPKMKR
jgi:hypothetical protein